MQDAVQSASSSVGQTLPTRRSSRGSSVWPAADGIEQTGPKEVISIVVSGPLPRWVPYKKGRRGVLYVTPEARLWRSRIAAAFLRAGGRKPLKGERVWVSYEYRMARSHADLDSITHSAQDALSKDALGVVDKEWCGCYWRTHGQARSPTREAVRIGVRYSKDE